MKTIVRTLTSDSKFPMATHTNSLGEKFLLVLVKDITPTPETVQVFQDKNIDETAAELNLVKLENPNPVQTPNLDSIPLRSISKFDLINKLIDLEVAEEFNGFINTLPIPEKLRWDSTQTISPSFPFIANNIDTIISTLGITKEQFNGIFSR